MRSCRGEVHGEEARSSNQYRESEQVGGRTSMQKGIMSAYAHTRTVKGRRCPNRYDKA
jgi:hypothetical protein